MYGEIRNLIGYFKENHSDLFRKMAFSCMIEPYVRMHQAAHVNKLKVRVCERKLAQLAGWRARVQTIAAAAAAVVSHEAPPLAPTPIPVTALPSTDTFATIDGSMNAGVCAGGGGGGEAAAALATSPLALACESDAKLLDSIGHKLESLRESLLGERVHLDARCLVQGLAYYRFFMDSLPPASIPDVSFMGAFLELDAPVLSKAAFLLQTAHFVHKCNRKEWPEWLKSNLGPASGGGPPLSAGAGGPSGTTGATGSSASYSYMKSLSNVTRRNKRYQLAAASMFAAWAEVLADQLDSILSTATMTTYHRTNHTNHNNHNDNDNREIGVEDYFVDGWFSYFYTLIF